MKLDENGNKKKLPKRDLGLDMKDYQRGGLCAGVHIVNIS